MASERWERVKCLVDEALARDSSERARFLDEGCAGDDGLRAEVESLLRHEQESFLEPIEAPEDRLVGRALAHYRVVEQIGRGGMGLVYRARDSKLGRDVAIKVLPEAVAANPDRLKRFEREARLVAALNHPNVAAIHGLEQEGGTPFLVLELVAGETLQEKLRRGPIPMGDALRLAQQIAEALEAAHEKGIVHRDLKPSNLKVTEEGAVKVLDFGLAKAFRDRASGDEVEGAAPAEIPTTKDGIVMGTPSYMSPEQVGGIRVDHRTDVWSFGVVLWEMLAGERLFDGETTAEILGAVLRDEPDWTRLPERTPDTVRVLLRRCLTRERRNRLQAIGEARILIGEALQPGAAVPTAERVAAATSAQTRFAWLVAAGFGVLATVFGLAWLSGMRPPAPLLQSTLLAPPGLQLDPRAGFALSPDGRRLAFVAREADGVRKLWVRPLAALEARPLAALPGAVGDVGPFWSPDGRDVAFFADQKLKRVPAAGGAVQVLAGSATEPKGGTWSPDGRIVYVPDYRTGLFEVPANGGEPRVLTKLAVDDGELSHRWPQFLPDGRTLLFLVQTAEAGANDDRSRIEALDPDGGRHQVLKLNASAAYAAPERMLFWRAGSIYAQALDPKRWRLRGEAQLVAESVGLTLSEWATFAVSHEGTLVYASAPPWRLEWRERTGRLLSVAAPEGRYSDASLSPDGRRLVYVADNLTVRILDLLRGTNTRLTFEELDHYAPAWGPHGEWVFYSANKQAPETGSEIRRRRASGLGDNEVLYSSRNVVRHVSCSPDGRWIAFEESEDIFLLDLASRAARRRLGTPASERHPTFSPDGRWLAYSSDESGRDEVYVVPVFDGPARWQVSSRGGFEPRWGPGGHELFLLGPDYGLRAAKVALGKGAQELEFGPPEPLFFLPGAKPGTSYSVGPDGRILTRTQLSEGGSESFKLVLNWPRLLEESPR
jgi:Tol biopolymer transport system component